MIPWLLSTAAPTPIPTAKTINTTIVRRTHKIVIWGPGIIPKELKTQMIAPPMMQTSGALTTTGRIHKMVGHGLCTTFRLCNISTIEPIMIRAKAAERTPEWCRQNHFCTVFGCCFWNCWPTLLFSLTSSLPSAYHRFMVDAFCRRRGSSASLLESKSCFGTKEQQQIDALTLALSFLKFPHVVNSRNLFFRRSC